MLDLLLSTFGFGSAPFVELREQIWLSVFDFACRSQMNGLIFTFNPETTVRPDFVDRALDTVVTNGGKLDFVELVCPLDELKKRIDNPSRLQYRKLNSLAFFEKLHAAGEFDTSHMPLASITIDTSLHAPAETARQIAAGLHLTGTPGSE